MKKHLFAKLFSNTEYKEDFLNGKIYMCSLGYFKGLELAQGTKGDPLEGIGSYLQAKRLIVELEVNGKKVNLKPEGAMTIGDEGYRYLKVFCLYAPEIDLSDPAQAANNIKPSAKMIEDFGQDLVFITNPNEFKRRLEIALKEKRGVEKYGYDHVRYYNSSHHGHFDDSEIPFSKHEEFDFQKEFRIVLRTSDKSESSFEVEIGDIRDICIELKAAEFNERNLKFEAI